MKIDRAKYWLSVGAQPSERVAKLFAKVFLVIFRNNRHKYYQIIHTEIKQLLQCPRKQKKRKELKMYNHHH